MCNLSDIIEERGIQKGFQIGMQTTIYELVQSGLVTLERGAEVLDISVEQLKSDMKAANFNIS